MIKTKARLAIQIVSSSNRQILDVQSNFKYVYIPLTEDEIEACNAEHITDPCFRITVLT